MRRFDTNPTAIGFLVCVVVLLISSPARAQLDVVFGTTWDSPSLSLQNILDNTYGPGVIDVMNDYVGKSASDPDPFFWADDGFDAFLIKEVAGYRNNNTLGWYEETGSMPVIDGVNDGVIFAGPIGPAPPRSFRFRAA